MTHREVSLPMIIMFENHHWSKGLWVKDWGRWNFSDELRKFVMCKTVWHFEKVLLVSPNITKKLANWIMNFWFLREFVMIEAHHKILKRITDFPLFITNLDIFFSFILAIAICIINLIDDAPICFAMHNWIWIFSNTTHDHCYHYVKKCFGWSMY